MTAVGPKHLTRMPRERCPHMAFDIRANVVRLITDDGNAERDPERDAEQPPTALDLEIMVLCLQCDTAFEFIGLPYGLSPTYPTVGLDGLTLTAPMRPQGASVDFGLDRPGFSLDIYQEWPPLGEDVTPAPHNTPTSSPSSPPAGT